jgi:diguanylate cyclase (GGDEF)-like protein
MSSAVRLAMGPTLSLLAAGAIFALERMALTVPRPGIIVFVTVALAAYIGGWLSALLSALISIAFTVIYFSTPGLFLHFTPDNLNRIVIMTVGTLTIVAIVAALRHRSMRGLEVQHARATELERLAEIDGLTGLYNRRQFLALAEQEWVRFKRYQRPLSFLMLDIDFFKSINDSFGHDAGDKVIVGVANICTATRRSSEPIGRIGGEELAILLPETDLRGAAQVAERLRARIAEEPIRVEGELIPVTVSIGVADASFSTSSLPDLMKQADRALYAAKRKGRNRVEAAGATHEDSKLFKRSIGLHS